MEFYENELNIVAGEFAENTFKLSEKLLNDLNAYNETTVVEELKELKNSMEHFLRDYPHIKRFKLYQPLLTLYLNVIRKSSAISLNVNSDFQQKFGDIVMKYYGDITKNFEENYMKNIKGPFLKKLEDFYKKNEVKNMSDLRDYISDLKSCQKALCLPIKMDSLLKALEPPQDLFQKYGKLLLNKYIAFIYIRIYYIGKDILKTDKLSELDVQTKENLIKDINEFLKEFVQENDIEKMLAATSNKEYFITKYYNNTNLKDHKLLQEIFENSKLSISNSEYENEILRSMFDLKEMFDLFLTSDNIQTWLFVN